LLALVIFQALLGMWTVTEQLKPMVVASHLAGGMATLALLGWLASREGTRPAIRTMRPGQPVGLARGVLFLVALQIGLGGWVSANYAALACPDLPTCQGAWWPEADFSSAFGLSHPLGGLPAQALIAIHLAHRLAAVLVLAGVLALAWRLAKAGGWSGAAGWLLAVVFIQILLGMGNVLLDLSLPVAVAHNAGAAALLLSLVWVNARLARSPS
jgi:cytochrome c oxidase assembly protein subunit 15